MVPVAHLFLQNDLAATINGPSVASILSKMFQILKIAQKETINLRKLSGILVKAEDIIKRKSTILHSKYVPFFSTRLPVRLVPVMLNIQSHRC